MVFKTGFQGINGPVISRIAISKIDSYRIFASFAIFDQELRNYGMIESGSGGWSWGNNSIDILDGPPGNYIQANISEYTPFYMLSVSPFNDSTMFGLDSSFNLIKTFNGGISSAIVDQNKYWDKTNIDFYYDINQSTLYVLSLKSGNYYLLKSDEFGESGSWQLLIQSNKEVNFAIDDSVSGEAYYSLGKILYKTQDYGDNFSVFDKLNQPITGLYKKPNTNILYLSTPYYIYECENTQKEIIKSVSADNSLQYYPLSVGDKWTYKVTGMAYTEEAEEIDYTFTKEVVEKVTWSNSKAYFKSKITRSNRYAAEYIYERIDSAEGRIYQHVNSNEEIKFDFKHVPGDTIEQYVEFYDHLVNTVYGKDSLVKYDDHWFPSKKYLAWYKDYYLVSAGLGLLKYTYTFDFGYENCKLLGAYVNGNYYGDTLMVHVDDNPIEQPTEFRLSQNYPNPFNPTTTIEYTLPAVRTGHGLSPQSTRLVIYDILGREVVTLVNMQQSPGKYNVEFDASGLASGVYYYRLNSGKYTETRKLCIVK